VDRRRGTHEIAVRRRYLNLFRGIIPPLGGTIDLSPILAFITLDVRKLHAAFASVLCVTVCTHMADGQGIQAVTHCGRMQATHREGSGRGM
jgi:YGGT family